MGIQSKLFQLKVFKRMYMTMTSINIIEISKVISLQMHCIKIIAINIKFN
jgi:hypothetical protein